MERFWRKLRSYNPVSGERARSSPRMADVALEVLQNLEEEAKDVIYYEALNRIHGESDKQRCVRSRDSKKWSTVRRHITTLKQPLNDGRTKQDTKSNMLAFLGQNPLVTKMFDKILSVYSTIRSIVMDPQSDVYYAWTGIVALAILYNYWVIILRATFSEMRDHTTYTSRVFMFCNLLADCIYILDIGVQSQTAYLENGILVHDQTRLLANYKRKSNFVFDIFSILPLCFVFQYFLGPSLSQLLRMPRLFKWHTISAMFEMSDSRTTRPNGVRALKLTIYLAIIIHWFACFYFMICEYEGFGTTAWTYGDTKGQPNTFIRKYVKSLFWAALTLTTIGENESPETILEYVFTGCTFLIGILLFATIVGNMGDVISSMNAARVEFQERMDGIKRYMEHHQIPNQLQDRVKKWLQYSWLRTKALEESTLGNLPHRLRTEIAIHVHLETLKKVKIFKDCEQGFLCELVLKLRSQIFSPDDYICRIGEIGREMYIINHGKVEIVVRDSVSGEPVVVASLSEGNCFGEISLLRLDGGTNRRSADVRSVGYSELLCLSKKDLMKALEEYPEAKEILEAQGRDRLQRTKREKNENMLGVENMDKSENVDDGMMELKYLVEQLKSCDKLVDQLQTTQLQNKCEALVLEVHQLKEELKKSRKRSRLMETLLLGKPNGLCDSGSDIEQVVNNNNSGDNNSNLPGGSEISSANRLNYYSLRDCHDSLFDKQQDKTRYNIKDRLHFTNNRKRRDSI